MTRKILIRKAKMADVRSIHNLLNYFADKRALLPRSLSEVYENIQSFFVATSHGRVVGCCALYVTWEHLAEVKALAVVSEFQGRGVGNRLLLTTIKEAKKLGVEVLFTLTIREDIFKKFGFKYAKKSLLPHKVWTECVRCPFFPDTCIETSMTLDLTGKKKKPHRDKFTRTFMSTAQPMVPNEPTDVPRWPPPRPSR